MAWTFCALWLSGVSITARADSQNRAEINRISDIRNLSPSEARKALPATLRGIVTYYEPQWYLLFVQDDTGGIYVEPRGDAPPLRPGQRVEVKGVTSPGIITPVVTKSSVEVLGQGDLPQPKPVSVADLAFRKYDAEWVQVEGTVRSIGQMDGRLQFQLGGNGQKIEVTVHNLEQQPASRFLGSRVRVQGILTTPEDSQHRLLPVRFVASSFDDIRILQPGPADIFGSEPIPPGRIASTLPASGEPPLIRTRGRVSDFQPGKGIRIADLSGSVFAETSRTNGIDLRSWVDVAGYPSASDGEVRLQDIVVRRNGVPTDFAPDNFAIAETNGALPRLTTAQLVRAMPPDEADRGYPVRLRGVITYYDPGDDVLFMQGASEGIYINTGGSKLDVNAGDLVVLYGRSGAGDYAPIITEPRFDILGSAPMPRAARVTFEQMISGQWDSQWIETEGVVRSVTVDAGLAILNVATHSGGRFKGIVGGSRNKPLPTHLIDAEIQIQAVCGSMFNKNRQLAGIQLFIPDLPFVSVIKSGDSDPFGSGALAIRNIMQFHSPADAGHRVHTRGVVTLQQQNGSIYIQDETAGLFVQGSTNANLAVGQRVDVSGFPALGEYSPVLQNATVTPREMALLPQPTDIVPEDLLSDGSDHATNDCRLVTVKGTVLDTLPGARDETLILQGGQMLYQAVLERGSVAQRLPTIRQGSVIQATGICLIQVDENRTPRAFRIQLRSPSDIKVLQTPPWWRLRYTLFTISGLGAVAAGAMAWVLALRRQVDGQTRQLRVQLENETALEMRFRVLIDHAADAIFVHDAKGKLIIVNDSACNSLGYSREELLGLNIGDIAVEGEPSLSDDSKRWETLTPGQTLDVTGFHQRKDGSRFAVEARLGVFEERGAKLFVVLARNVTDRQNLEAQLRQSQKMESVGQLAGGIAHDFNNLLTVIQGHASLLLADGALPARETESVQQIADGAQRAANLTRQLLAFSRRQLMQPHPLNLNGVVNDLIKMLRRILGEDISLELQCEPDLPLVLADAGMMEQVLINLAVNARDAMPKGGKLMIRTRSTSFTASEVQSNLEATAGPAVCLDVSDSGMGIPPEHLGRIFEPFFTTKEVGKGTGLGLATVHGIVKQHMGWISVRSAVGEGTTFEVYLPAIGRPASPKHEDAPTTDELPVRGGHETILVVEDEESLRKMAVKALTLNGYRVHSAASAVSAKEIWKLHSDEIDLLVSDVVMPDGMDGYELAAQLAAAKPSLRIILTSGYNSAFGVSANHDGRFHFLPKPYKIQALAGAVRDCLDQPPSNGHSSLYN